MYSCFKDAKALDAPVKRSPQPSMVDNLLELHTDVQNNSKNMVPHHPLKPDVCLIFADHEVFCHSTILRARSEFFASFFEGDYWTRRRWNDEGMVKLNLSHMKWKVASYVVKFLYGGDIRIFDVLGAISSFHVEHRIKELIITSDRFRWLCQ